MADLKNKYGEVVYRIEGDRIIDIYGNWKYEIRGEYIFDTFGNRKFEIRDDWLYDTNGNRLGEMKNLVEYLDPPGDSNKSRTPNYSGSSNSPVNGSGCSGFLFGFFLLAFWHFLKGPFVAFSLIKETSARKEWWGTVVRSFFLSLLFTIVFVGIVSTILDMTNSGRRGNDIAGYILLLIWLIFGMLPIIVVSIRRMHDIGKRGWWVLIPLVNFVMCGFFRSKVDGNPYI